MFLSFVPVWGGQRRNEGEGKGEGEGEEERRWLHGKCIMDTQY